MVCYSRVNYARRKHFWVWGLAFFILVGFGIVYRLVAVHWHKLAARPIVLEVPLNQFPLKVGTWEGIEVPVPQAVQKVAGNDDFISRRYVSDSTRQWANIYIAYTARPRTMLGHQPDICYPAAGWVHDGTINIKIRSVLGREIPCLLHRFHRPAPYNDEAVVLNYYILNGRLTDDESVFTGMGWRTPNIDGDVARYVTQVQIVSVLENSVRCLAQDFADLILDYFPDENGRVKVQGGGTDIQASLNGTTYRSEAH